MRPWNKKRQETYGLGLATIILLVLPKKSHEKRQYFPLHWTLWNVLKFYYSRMIKVAFKGVYLGGHWASGRGGNDLVWFPPLRPNYFPISWQSFYFRFQVVDLNITKPLWQLLALHISCFSINQWMHVFVAGRSCVVLWRRCKIPRTTNYITIRTGGSLMVCYFRPDESPALKLPFVGSLRACSMHRFQGRCNPKAM